MFSAIFVLQVFRLFKVPKKFRKNYIKNQRKGTFRKNQEGAGGPPPGTQEGAWRSPPGPCQGTSWLPWVAPRLLPSPIFTPQIRNPWTKTLFRETLSVPPPPPFQDRGCLEKLLRHPAGRRYPSGRPSIAMDASRMCRE